MNAKIISGPSGSDQLLKSSYRADAGDADSEVSAVERRTDELIERVRALQPLIRERAHQAESQGRITEDIMEQLAAAGVWRALTPTRWGGLGLGLRALCEVARIASQADTSTGWIACFLMEHNWMACRLMLSAQERVFGGGPGYILAAAPLAPGGTLTPVAGGFRVSGKWRYASGILHAGWTFASCIAEVDSKKIPYMCLLPIESVTIHDDWHMAGMAATNSTNLSASDVFVPYDMALEMDRFFSADRHPGVAHPEAIYHYPLLPGLLTMLGAVALGSAQNALQLARERLSSTAPWGVRRIDRATSRMRWINASQDLRCAQLLYEDMLRRAIQQGEAAQQWRPEEQGQHELDLVTVTHLSKDAVASLLDGFGTSVYQLGDPLQRHFRDLCMLASHLGNDWDVVVERSARFVLGLGTLPGDPGHTHEAPPD